jgi:acetylornithine deacetylase
MYRRHSAWLPGDFMNQDFLDKKISREIMEAVDAGFDDQIKFTQDLVRIPSQMREEQLAQDFIASAMKERGYGVDRWQLDVAELEDHPGFSPVEGAYDNALNVVGTHRPQKEEGRSLILNGHIDVVPVGPLQQWSANPYEPYIDGDWLYGRGSGDMKAGLVANIFALDALKHTGYQPASTVYLQSVIEEECTGNGALACLVKGYDADAVIIPEPLGEKLIRASTGLVWFRVKILGKPAHPAMPGTGINAIESAYGIIKALKGLEEEWNERRADHPLYRDNDRSINLNVGKIRGGDWASSVPAWCTVDCRINIFPGIHPRDLVGEIEECIRQHAASDPGLSKYPPAIEYPGHFSSGYVLEPGSDAEKVLARAHKESSNSDLEDGAFTGYVDATVYAIYAGRPSLVYGPTAENIHSYDERVSLSSVKRITKTIALFAAQWCGLERV